jgi:lysyl-tRNA synthetase class 2
MDEQSPLIQQRAEKAAQMRANGENPYANDFRVKDHAADLIAAYDAVDGDTLEAQPVEVAVAGRVRAVRSFGRAVFVVLQDATGQIQANLFKPQVPAEDWARLELLDIGDIVGVNGTMMRTRKGELSINSAAFRILTKSMRPLPDKWHGLTDVATRYRQRYVDLIVNEEVRRTFRIRAKVLRYIREFLDGMGYIEVETPMLQAIYGGALARPFKTHHNAMDMELYLRIAPELNLKRLVVGGLHRVYDLNRCFRNEGISTQHNPEFTMLEHYQAFATYEDLMALTEELLSGLCEKLHGTTEIPYGDTTLSFATPFRRLSVYDGLVEHAGIAREHINDRAALLEAAQRLGVKKADDLSIGYLQMEVFEAAAEHLLVQPTFVTDFPVEVSPLARRKESNPDLVDRYELYIAGREVANAFSELNDPVDQRGRFEAQVEQREQGDAEAHGMDEDYVRALEYGLPPTAGQGIGIDRIVMVMTNSPSIRDVILFPLLRPEA